MHLDKVRNHWDHAEAGENFVPQLIQTVTATLQRGMLQIPQYKCYNYNAQIHGRRWNAFWNDFLIFSHLQTS